MTFGQVIAEARKNVGLSQKDVAELVKKEDGQPISQPYLNDIEHDRRNPPSDHLIGEFARALGIETDVLYYWAGRLPIDLRSQDVNSSKIVAAYKALRKALSRG